MRDRDPGRIDERLLEAADRVQMVTGPHDPDPRRRAVAVDALQVVGDRIHQSLLHLRCALLWLGHLAAMLETDGQLSVPARDAARVRE